MLVKYVNLKQSKIKVNDGIKKNNKNKKKNKSYERGVVVVSVEKLKVGSSIYSSTFSKASGRGSREIYSSRSASGRQAAGKRVVRIGSRLSIWLDWRQKV